MEMLPLAMKAGLPLIYLQTQDLINVEQVLSYIAEEAVQPLNLPTHIDKISDLKIPKGRLFYTTVECKTLVKLYHFAVNNGLSIIFVNTEKSVLQFDGGTLIPPKGLVLEFLTEISDNPEELLPCYGGLTLKDVGEVSKLTMTRDEALTPRGVNETRRGYANLKGIQQVTTEMEFYVCPSYLREWLDVNTGFFLEPVHPSLTPRGLLFDGPPGVGKTLASKAIAASFGIPLYHLDIGALKGKYVGDSEGALLAALAQADAIEPCVLLLDEVEKIFQTQGDSGVTSSLLSQMLWWLQEHKSRVFTVMTTNNREKIPSELYREGRIDKVMDFEGIESYKEGYAFAKAAFDSMLARIGAEADEEGYKELNKKIKEMFVGSTAVPQSKLTQTTYSLVREMMAAANCTKEN